MKKVLLACLLAASAAFPLVTSGGERASSSRVDAERLDGTRYSLSESRGTITVLMVWSPDSLASRKSIGELQRFSELAKGKGVAVMAVSTLGGPDRLRHYAADRALDLPMAILGDNDLGPLPEQSLPLLFVFDRDGRCQSTHRGLFRLRDIESLVTPLL